MLWRNEPVTPGSRWEIKKIDDYDPERLKLETQDRPLPPPMLGIRYYFWNHAPRAIPINKDPLRWLKLSPEDWQVSRDQMVQKIQGGEKSTLFGDRFNRYYDRDTLARFPDQPSDGPMELWERAKHAKIERVMTEHPMTRDEAYEDVADWFRRDGWLLLGRAYLRDHPEEISRWINEGAPITPTPTQVQEWQVAEWRKRLSNVQIAELVLKSQRMAIAEGWPTMVADYHQEHEYDAYGDEGANLRMQQTRKSRLMKFGM
jgi:hypothetical protein